MTPLETLQAHLEGRYRIERELGRGGMATVYLAQDLRPTATPPPASSSGRSRPRR